MGIIMSAGSDGPCTDPDPIQWIYKACNHSESEQSLSVAEALRMCTSNGSYQSFDEKERGSLEAGKIADMAILSENPFGVPTPELCRLKVEQLFLKGKPYEKVGGGPVGHILNGIFSR